MMVPWAGSPCLGRPCVLTGQLLASCDDVSCPGKGCTRAVPQQDDFRIGDWLLGQAYSGNISFI